MPKSLDKGTALKRFCAMTGASFTIAAGDSEFDTPMLNGADLAVCPAGLKKALHREDRETVFYEGTETLFGDFATEAILKRL